MNQSIDQLIEMIAQETNRSKETVIKDLESMIRYAYQDPKQAKKMKQLFGDTIPTLEQYLEKTTLKRYAKKNNC